jgi:hypothetical protein
MLTHYHLLGTKPHIHFSCYTPLYQSSLHISFTYHLSDLLELPPPFVYAYIDITITYRSLLSVCRLPPCATTKEAPERERERNQ